MQVLEAGQVAPGEDQVHALLVLDVEVADRGPVLVDDAEAQRLVAAARQLGPVDDEPQPALGDAEAADRVGGGGVALHGRGARLRVGAARLDRAARQRGGREGDDQQAGEGEQAEGHDHARQRITYPPGVSNA